MPTLTTNYSFNKPLVNNATDADLWGGYLNANWDSVDSILGGFSSFIIGAPIPYFGSSAPTNYLLCYGQSIGDTGSGADLESADYETLFDIVKACAPNTGSEVFSSGDTVAIPDMRGRVVAGYDSMGGVSANRLTDQSGGVDGDVLGDTGGSETHQLTVAEMPSHSHNISTRDGTGQWGGVAETDAPDTTRSTNSAGGDGAHNNVQPTIILNYIVKYK